MSNYWTGTRLDDIAEKWRKSRDAVERATVASKNAEDAVVVARKALVDAESVREDAWNALKESRDDELLLREALRDALVMDQKKVRSNR